MREQEVRLKVLIESMSRVQHGIRYGKDMKSVTQQEISIGAGSSGEFSNWLVQRHVQIG